MYDTHINKMINNLYEYKGREDKAKGIFNNDFLDNLIEALGDLERLMELLNENQRLAKFHLDLINRDK